MLLLAISKLSDIQEIFDNNNTIENETMGVTQSKSKILEFLNKFIFKQRYPTGLGDDEGWWGGIE